MSPFRLMYIPFPVPVGTVGGVTRLDVNTGRFLIAINNQETDDDLIRILKHELSHIALGHFDDDRTESLEEIEKEADLYADQMTDDEFSELMTYQVGETVFK